MRRWTAKQNPELCFNFTMPNPAPRKGAGLISKSVSRILFRRSASWRSGGNHLSSPAVACIGSSELLFTNRKYRGQTPPELGSQLFRGLSPIFPRSLCSCTLVRVLPFHPSTSLRASPKFIRRFAKHTMNYMLGAFRLSA